MPGQATRDSYVLDMISTYLSGGKSSVLYKKIVDDQKQALQVAAVNLGQVDYNIFALFALPQGEVELDVILEEMDEEIAVMQNELISERDYEKLMNQFENRFVNSNSSVEGIASSLATYHLLYGDANLINTQLELYSSITREEIRDVAKKYLSPNQRVEIKYLPKKMKTKMKTIHIKLIAFIGFAFFTLQTNAQIDRSKMPTPGPEPEINLEKPTEFKLKNGITVLVVENNKLPRVSYQLSIDNKPYVEGDKAGVASLLSSMLGNGTTSISKEDFNEEVDFLGANINFGSSGGFGSGLVKYSDRIVELMADATMNPLLTEEEFNKEKDKLIEGLKADEKSVDAASSRVVSALAYGKDHAFGEFVTEETVNNVTFQDVKDFYKLRFAPNNAYIVVIGDIDVKTAKKQLKKFLENGRKLKTYHLLKIQN